jgi:HEAT repeat protein
VQNNELEALWTLIQLLPSDVLKTLAPLSCKIDIQRFGPAFVAVFEYYCEIDSRYLAAVAGEIDTKICLQLFPFIQRLRLDQAIPVLSAMAHHSSQLIRRKAFQFLVDWDAVDIHKLFPLIEDPDETIRGTILSLAGKQRNPIIEKMLRKNLQEHAENTGDREHILACYHALGRSGSTDSIPFLKKCLFQGSKLGTLFATGGGAHKEGAARALIDLRIPEAKKIVQEGARNILPDVRAACRKALGTRHA